MLSVIKQHPFLAFSISLSALVCAFVLLTLWRVSTPEDYLPEVSSVDITVIDNVSIIDVEAGIVVPEQLVVIENGMITHIGTAGKHPTSVGSGRANYIDARGKFLMPGLVDMHVHLHSRRDVSLSLAYGVTTVRNLRGAPKHLRWRNELRERQWLGARLITASPSISGPRNHHALLEVVENSELARHKVRRYHEDGYDLIKIYGYLQEEPLQAALDEATRIGIPVARHGPHANGASLTLLNATQTVEHVEDIFQGPLQYTFDKDKLSEYVNTLKPVDTYVVPTLATFAHLTSLSTDKSDFVDTVPLHVMQPFYQLLLKEFSVKRWLTASDDMAKWNTEVLSFLLTITATLDKAGIRLVTGSDAGTMYLQHGLALHQEMQLMQQAGMSPPDVIAATTIAPMMAMGLDQQYGSVSKGKVADLLLLEANPLENVENASAIVAVIKHGQVYPTHYFNQVKQAKFGALAFFAGATEFAEDQWIRWWQR